MKNIKTWVAALLVLLLLSASALAELHSQAGTLRGELRQEALEAGLAVQQTNTLRIHAIEGLAPEALALAQQTVDSFAVVTRAFDDIDAQYQQAALTFDGTELLSFTLKTQGQEQWLTSSLLPEKVFALPRTHRQQSTGLLVPISAFSLFTVYLPNLPGLPDGRLSLTEEQVEELQAAMITYLSEFAAWISITQAETGQLYLYEYPELEETDTRDEVETVMGLSLAAADLKVLLRLFADTFYDDVAFYPLVADYLAVTEEEVYAFSRQWPLTIAALTATEETMHLRVLYNMENDVTGYELELPPMFEQVPVAVYGSLDRKQESDGVRQHGEIEIQLPERDGLWEAVLSTWEGEEAGDAVSRSYGLEAMYTEGENTLPLTAYLQHDARLDHAQDVERTTYRMQVTAGRPEEGNLRLLEVSGEGSTTLLSQEGFAGEDVYWVLLSVDVPGSDGVRIELEVHVETTVGDYTVPDFSPEPIDSTRLTQAQREALAGELGASGMSVVLKTLSLLPEQVRAALVEVSSEP